MKIAFLHYHTKKGGVTTVMGQQISVLRNDHNCIMIKGEKGGVDFGIPSHVVQGLGYDRNNEADIAPEEVGKRILEIVGLDCDVLHIHNPLLKKNSKLIKIIRYLKDHGVKLFLHIHDFAEDGRPGVYFKEDAYPSDVHYGVINKRDFRLLKQAGLREEGLHYLPNMVSPLPYGDWEGEKDLVLYPVRGIRRKNLGEILLLSQFLPDHLKLGITLPPNSPKDIDIFAIWTELARRLNLPVLFNLGEKEDFTTVLGRTRFVITTSIKEGFGFSYLEPWTIGKEVRGRYLSAVCPDFEEKGVHFSHLYKKLLIPLECFDSESFISRWKEGLERWAGQFDVIITDDEIRENIERRLIDGSIDFGLLDEEAQTQVIESISSNSLLIGKIEKINLWLKDFFKDTHGNRDREVHVIEENRKIILNTYGPDNYRKNLLSIYKKVKRHVPHGVEKKKVLDAFLKIENYLPLGS
jgi:hypothetical protein